MKILYFDCGMGAAGDMLTAALLELMPDPDAVIAELNGLGIPGVEYRRTAAVKCGITGTGVSVLVHGEEEGEHGHAHGHGEHDHHHDHHHEHDHHRSDLHGIEHIISSLSLSEKARADAIAVYTLIAEAESAVHGQPVTDIHFHEVGTLDAVADVAAVCLLMERIAPEEVVVSPVHVGSGRVRCAHGILPVPAPATMHLLEGVPIYSSGLEGELCTPTGAALLRHFATRFGPMPVMRTVAAGYGMGKKDFEQANCVRVLLGETGDTRDTVSVLSCNVDDMSAEEIGYAMDRLLESGAREVYTVPVGMKKDRPGTLIEVICSPEDKEKMAELVFRWTSTIGIRETEMGRYVLERRIETKDTPYGRVRVKKASGYGVSRQKPEYDDLARIARERDISIAEACALLEGV